jgi:hypothetical protein
MAERKEKLEELLTRFADQLIQSARCVGLHAYVQVDPILISPLNHRFARNDGYIVAKLLRYLTNPLVVATVFFWQNFVCDLSKLTPTAVK